MAKKKKLSITQQQYNKELKRIKSFIKRAEKRGYIFPKNAIPNKPKRISKSSVSRLHKITPEKLYNKAEYASELTQGEIVSAKQGLSLEKQARKEARIKKAKSTAYRPYITERVMPNGGYSEVVITNAKTTFMYFPPIIAEKMIQFLNVLIKQHGIDDVAYALEHMPYQFYEYMSRKGYASEQNTEDYCTALIDLLPEATEGYKREIMDAFEAEELGYYLED